MIEVKSYLDDREIIYHGNAYVMLGQTLKIHFTPIKIEINFLEDTNIEEKIDWGVRDGVLKVTFQNYGRDLGSGILQPWLIGDYKGRELFMSIFFRYINDGNIKCFDCTYILYSGKEIGNE